MISNLPSPISGALFFCCTGDYGAVTLEFLTSEDYNRITRKSKAHYAMIAAVAPKPRRPKKKD